MNNIIDFSNATHFISPHISFDAEYFESQKNFKWELAYESIAKYFGVKSDEIELFNSQSCAIFSLVKYLQPTKCYLYAPIYDEYKRATKAFQYETIYINRFEDLDIQIEENSLVIFQNPSIPDGKYYDLTGLFSQWMKLNATIIIDESFLDFTNEKSVKEYLKCYPKLFIIKSFAYFYGIPHIKLSAIISHKIAIQQLIYKEPIQKLSILDGYYIYEALKDKSFKKIAKALATKNNILLDKILHNSNLFEKIYPSNTNLLLGKLSNYKATQLQNLLFKDSIMIENCSDFDYLDEYHIRLTIQNTKDLEAIEKGLKKIQLTV